MPWKPALYPADWRAIVTRIRARAGDCCEATMASGERCSAPNGAFIVRAKADLERWMLWLDMVCATEVADRHRLWRPQIRVVLTSAHTCDCHPPCGNEDHLSSECQYHHLTRDAKLHARHAAETRRRKAGLVPFPELVVQP